MKTLKYIIPALGIAALFTACSEDSWNEKLDGFEVPDVLNKVENQSYTLTNANYATIASEKANVALAQQYGEEDALKAIGADCTFQTQEQARRYMPAFLRDSINSPFFALSNGSSVTINYNLASAVSEEVRTINAGVQSYTVSKEDYQAVWESEEDYIDAFAPAKPASKSIPALLKSQFTEAKAGDYVVVTYNEAATNPIFTTVGGGEEEPDVWQATAVLGTCKVGDNVDVKGWVTAIDARGFVLTDASGSILCYQASGFDVASVAIGDQVNIAGGAVSAYNKGLQIAITNDSYTVEGKGEYTYPEPKVYTGAMMDQAVTRTDDALCEYVVFTGTCSISGNYINFAIEGAETAQGSGYQVPQFIKDQLSSGEAYDIYGYFASVSSSRYFNVVITDVKPAGSYTPGSGDSGFKATAVLGSCKVGDNVDVKGWVTAIDARGFVLTDLSGSILCYQASGFDVNSVAIGDQVSISSAISSYGTALQIAISDGSYTVEGKGTYTYPAPKVYTAAMMDEAVARTDNYLCEYVMFNGTCSISGNYVNFIIDGASTAQGSGYQVPQFIKDQLTNGETYDIYGYFASVSSARYFNVVITAVKAPGSKAPRRYNAPAAEVPSTQSVAIYTFNGSTWTAPNNTVCLQPADYKAMGESYGNLSGNGPAVQLPKFLAVNYPYAGEGDQMTVVYNYYDGTANSWRATQFNFNEGVWSVDMGLSSDKFTRMNGWWQYNPSVELVLPYVRNTDPSYTVYMACVNWVWENICLPMGNTEEMLANKETFIDYRKNAEFYSGASAYYGNVDVRATTAINNAPKDYTGYEGLSNEQITELVMKRFSTQTLPGALAALYPEADVEPGMEITYTITFTAYTGAAEVHTIVYKVVGKAQFEYVSSTWVSDEVSKEWIANPIK